MTRLLFKLWMIEGGSGPGWVFSISNLMIFFKLFFSGCTTHTTVAFTFLIMFGVNPWKYMYERKDSGRLKEHHTNIIYRRPNPVRSR